MGGVLGVTDERTLTPLGEQIVGKHFIPRAEGSAAVPAWVTGTTATFASPVFNRESPALLAIREKIMAAFLGRRTTEVLVAGDSKCSPYQGVVEPWPEQMRRMLGAVDGFVQADNGVMDPRWSVTGLSLAPTTTVGLQPTTPGGGGSKTATFTADEDAAGGTLLVRIPAGGPATVTVNGTPQEVAVPVTAGWHPIILDTTPDVDGPLAVTITSTADLSVAGIVLLYAEPRLRISNPARPSSAASDWSPGAPTGRWATIVDGLASNPDVIISALGTNEITDLAALTTYYDALGALGVPIVVVSPGGLGGSRTRADAEALAAHLYSIAQEHDWPLVDAERIIGTYDEALEHLLMLDTLHENTRAALLIALVFYALLFGGA